MLVSWSRLLVGRLRDPLLGRDMLLGVFMGCAAYALLMLALVVGQPGRTIVPSGRPLPAGIGWHIASLATAFTVPGQFGLLIAVCFAVSWVLLHRWGIAATWALATCLLVYQQGNPAVGPAVQWTLVGFIGAVEIFVLARWGVTALAATAQTLYLLVIQMRGLDLSAWHQTPGRVAAILILLLASYALHTALAGRRVFGSTVLGDPER